MEGREFLIGVQQLSACVYNRGKRANFHYLRDISLDVCPNQIVGLVGESGSGKTRLASVLNGTLFDLPGVLSGRLEVREGGQTHSLDFARIKRGLTDIRHSMAEVRRKALDEFFVPFRKRVVGYIPQGAKSALNPYFTLDEQLASSFRQAGIAPQEIPARSEAMRQVFNLQGAGGQYPYSMSGGQASRAVIAIELARSPRLIIADEPTTGVDGPYQVKILKELERFVRASAEGTRTASGKSLLMITHQIELLLGIADRIIVMYCGEILEILELGGGGEPSLEERHPYTRLLLSIAKDTNEGKLRYIRDEMPSMYVPPTGCIFASRCPEVEDECRVGSIGCAWKQGNMVRCLKRGSCVSTD